MSEHNEIQKKNDIINAASILFLKQGYEKTSVASIAKGANVAKGLVYYYFESKDEILEDVIVSESKNNILTLRSTILENKENYLDNLILLMKAYYAIHPLSHKTTFELTPDNQSYIEAFHAYYLKQVDDILDVIITEAQRDGALQLKYPSHMIIMTLEGLFKLMRIRDVSHDEMLTVFEQSLNLIPNSLLHRK